MKKLIICITMMLAFSLVTNAQSVQRQGNTFTQVTNDKKKVKEKEIKTEYVYKDKKGVEHPIYLSATGKAFIYYINKKGEQKRRYMPEIGRQINPEAYKDEK